MKGLLKYLSPFAPDQSGAVSVFYELGGIIVICDAGGCTGNICGFDEPRWFMQKSALFSAGLRDMDAILGRDDRLVEKLKDAAGRLGADFAVLVGTPVPAVIATDFRAMKRMAQKKCGIPILTVECTGTRLYDQGAREAYVELFRAFADRDIVKDESTAGVIGAVPLDVSRVRANIIIEKKLKEQGFSNVYCYGMGCGLDAVKKAGSASVNIVLSPAGVAAARYLQETFGTPYETAYPLLKEDFLNEIRSLSGKRVLIVHQQVAADEMRRAITGKSYDPNVVCGSWFMQLPELMQRQDVHFEREEQFASFVRDGRFDAVIGDKRLKRALRDYSGIFLDCPHFAVSGTLEEEI